jgi:hypothetical protein
MYVLVAILFLDQRLYKIDPAPILFPNYELCMVAKELMDENLMATAPTKDAWAITYCSEVPKGV